MSHSLRGCRDSLLLKSVSFEFRSLFDSDFDSVFDLFESSWSSSLYSSMNIDGFVSQRFCGASGTPTRGGETFDSRRYWF